MESTDLAKKIGHQIQEIRKSRGYSQDVLAEKSGFHRTYIGMVERGERQITVSALQNICKALGIKMSEVIDGCE